MSWQIGLAEKGALPDAAVRAGIRMRHAAQLRALSRSSIEEQAERTEEFIRAMAEAPIALVPEKANEQHYETPADFFGLVLGPRRKYSCCLYAHETATLEEAEETALAQVCERAGVEDGMRILDLGCGWGSFSLYAAERFSQASIHAVSNSRSQKDFIEATAASRGLSNLTVETADMNTFQAPARFDRVVSIEMFEHMRNWQALLGRVRQWLQPEGRAFVHIFCHRRFVYEFDDGDDRNWMARNFFSGGMMPSEDLMFRHQRDLEVLRHWRVDGRHYGRTCNDWLERLDAQMESAEAVLGGQGSDADAQRQLQRWRIFFMACAELFDYHGGREWYVSHYLLAPG
jgi:cyclopropane-fatty-acyl-phospholipid synthase